MTSKNGIVEFMVDYLCWTWFDVQNEKRITGRFIVSWFAFLLTLSLTVIGAGYALFYIAAMLRVLAIYI